MWFYLGLVTVSVSLIIYLYQKLSIQSALQQRKSSLQYWTYNKKPFKYDLTNASSKNTGLFVLEIPCVSALQFSARQERQKDKWAKRLGISYEFETGSQQFDQQTYLASITQEDAEIIGKDSAMMSEIRGLIFSKQDVDVITRRNLIICDGKHLYLEIHLLKDSPIQQVNALAARFLPRLRTLANLLQSQKRETAHFWKVPAQRNTAIFLAMSLALATWGGLEAARFFILDKNALFSPISLMPEASIISALALLTFILLAFRFIKKSARRHLVLIDIVIFGGLGLLFTVYGLLYDFNSMSDSSEPTIASYQVVDKYSVKHRGRKGRTYYTYHINLKDAEYPIDSPMKIDHDFYDTICKTDWVSFTIRDGRLHKPWLENMYRCLFCKDPHQENDF